MTEAQRKYQREYKRKVRAEAKAQATASAGTDKAGSPISSNDGLNAEEDRQKLDSSVQVVDRADKGGRFDAKASALRPTATLIRNGGKLHPWQPGHSGNPNGTPNGGMAVAHWFNLYLAGDYSREELEHDATDPSIPPAKAIAAGRVLDARSRDRTKGGVPIAGPEVDRILDRTIGRPIQQTVIVAVRADEHLLVESIAADTESLAALEIISRRQALPHDG